MTDLGNSLITEVIGSSSRPGFILRIRHFSKFSIEKTQKKIEKNGYPTTEKYGKNQYIKKLEMIEMIDKLKTKQVEKELVEIGMK